MSTRSRKLAALVLAVATALSGAGLLAVGVHRSNRPGVVVTHIHSATMHGNRYGVVRHV